MKNLLLLLIAILFLGSYQNYKNGNIKTVDGTVKTALLDTILFEIDGFNSGETLALISNNTFFHKIEFWGCTGGGEEIYVLGKYTQQENLITLVPKRIKKYDYWNEEDSFNYDDPDVKEYEFHKDSIFMNIRRTYYLLEKGKKTYLLSPEREEDFYENDSNTNDFEEYSLMSKDKENQEIYFSGSYFFTIDTILFGNFGEDKLPEQYLSIIKN